MRPWPRRGGAWAALMLVAVAASAQAPDPHAGHHPPTSDGQAPSSPPIVSAPPSPSPPPPASPPGGMMDMMMMGTPKKQLYPELMELPVLTPEARRRIESEARARINAANAAMVEAQSDYHRAMLANDAAAMSRAFERQRAAMAEMQSGTTALRALADNRPPREIALEWFRGTMGIAAPAAPSEPPGPFGLSWLHIVSMAGTGTLLVALLALGMARRRRSLALIDRLASAGTGSRSIAPAMAGGPAPAVATPPAGPRASTWSGLLRVAAIQRETPTVKTFRFVDPAGGSIPFTYQPGQFLTFTADIDGRTVRRAYSIASPPTRPAYVEITVKREDDGIFSDFLHDRIKVGDTLEVSGPAGAFTFDGGGAGSIVLIAGGVGITPLMCVVRHLADTTWPGEVFFLIACRSPEDFIFREELEYLQRRWPRLEVAAIVMTRPEGAVWMGLEGQLSRDVIERAVPSIKQRRVHLCGPPPMMDAIRTMLADLGVPADQIKTEAFGPAQGAVPPPRRPERSPAMPVIGPASATVSFARSGKSAALPPDRTVLDVAESIGVPIDYACRVGTCGLCKVRLVEGKVTMEVQDALSPEDKAGGMILACQARSLGNLIVDA